jgi:peptidoglycan/xylan/chitin deacetylase (PgdA/CDA1 family)
MRPAEAGSESSVASGPRKGVFTLSLDLELLWGTVDLHGPERFRRACEVERQVVIDRLLGLLDEHGISATWCILGHLFLSECRRSGGVAHPEVVRPRHRWVRGDWLQHDPCSDESRAPLFYGRSLVEKIRACRTPQEIGSHSFSHAIFSDEGCSREAAASELSATRHAAREIGLELRSFAFPRNGIGHLDLLPQFGIRSYRGPAPRWYERREPPPTFHRLARLWAVVAASPPPVVTPEPSGAGLTNVPASMIYLPMHGLRRHIGVSRRVLRAQKGLAAAVRSGRVFHLWFHPTNLADEPEAMFRGLREILATVQRLVREGGLRVATMGELACPSR